MYIQGEANSTLPKTREGGRGQTKHQPSATAQGNPGGMQLQTIQTCSPPVTFRAIARRSASSTQKVVANHKNGTSEPRVPQKLYIPKTRIMKRGVPSNPASLFAGEHFGGFSWDSTLNPSRPLNLFPTLQCTTHTH